MPLRPALAFINKYFSRPIVGMEVGVEYGKNLEQILDEMPKVKKMYAVDPYKKYDEYLEEPEVPWDEVQSQAHKTLNRFGDRVEWIKKEFVEGIANDLDFVYIDGNHRYEFVSKDIVNAIRSVKTGGIIAGHDYGNPNVITEVKIAVDNFCEKYNVELFLGSQRYGEEGIFVFDWWFINSFGEEEKKNIQPLPLCPMPLKILAVSAVYNDEENLPRCLERLNNLTTKIEYHIFVTNNCTDRTDEIIDEHLKIHPGKRISYNVHPEFVKKIGDPYAPAAIAWQRGLREARRMLEDDPSWTHVLYFDSDIYVSSKDAIERLAVRNKSIIGGVYNRSFPDGLNIASVFIINDNIIDILPQFRKNRGEGFHFDKIFFDLLEIHVTSNGLCLYTREVMMDKRINFWPIYKGTMKSDKLIECSPEFGYQMQARSYGYLTWLEGTIVLGHAIGKKHRPHTVIDDIGTYVDFKYLK